MMTGLTSNEVLARQQRGEGNNVKLTTSRSYFDIAKTNLFNPVNVVLYAIGAGMVLVGDARSAITTVMLVAFNAVESLSNVTVLCTDKTGTLTANKIRLHDVHPIAVDKATLEQRLADFACNASAVNKTTEAIVAWRAGEKRRVVDEVPFSLARKWSGLAFDDPALRGVYVLGALEMVQAHFASDDAALARLAQWSEAGLRVLVFAHNPDVTTLHDAAGEVALPPLRWIGVIGFSDELRPHLQETLAAFIDNGVRLKVISGDNPQTVATLAKQAGLPGDLRAVSGPELAAMSEGEFAQSAAKATVFGRISPQQKEQLVDALRRQGEYVAMIGDGVNDVLSLKKANLGIAMESGSTATRAVASMVLLGDSFEAMPNALREGQRIVASIQNILKVYMVTVFALVLLISGISALQLGFPFTAPQNTILSFFARGAPPAILSVTALAVVNRTRLSSNVFHFTLPAALSMFVFGLLIYTGAFFVTSRDLAQVDVSPEVVETIARAARIAPEAMSAAQFNSLTVLYTAQTSLVTFFVLAGVLTMLFAEPPLRWFAGGAPYRGHWLTGAGAVVLIVAYYILLLLPGVRSFFELTPLPLFFHTAILMMTALWALLLRMVWRRRWLGRFLDLADDGFASDGEGAK